MDATLSKFIDAFLVSITIMAVTAVLYRMAACNEYEARLTGVSFKRIEVLCTDPPCVERVDPEAKPK